eukprot:COSAG03_NODE_576_length_6891_cov_135.585395_1_plen_311_part_00
MLFVPATLSGLVVLVLAAAGGGTAAADTVAARFVATVRLKQDDAVSTMHRQDRHRRGGDYPGFVATDNPLAGLPALAKPHYSFGRYNLAENGSGIDNRATLVDYARITSAFPVVPELSETAVRKAVGICQDAIRAGGGNCSLSISWSPYISQTAPGNFPNGSKVPYAVNVTTALELKILKEFQAYLINATRWAANESRIGKLSVGIGAILLDQEVFQTGSSLDPAIRKATSQKNNAYYTAAKQACPSAEVIQYNRACCWLSPDLAREFVPDLAGMHAGSFLLVSPFVLGASCACAPRARVYRRRLEPLLG